MMDRKQFFDMHAQKWDSFITPDHCARIEHDILPLFGIRGSEQILDVGTGTGILLPFLQKAAGAKGQVTALDYSQAMLDRAREKFGDAFRYVCADAAHTPFAGSSFDTVICYSVFPHFPHKLAVLHELSRVLRIGGKLFIAHADVRESINSFHSKVGGPVANDHMPDDAGMTLLLKKAGFEKITIEEGKDYYIASGFKP